jgi:hypothetical protein
MEEQRVVTTEPASTVQPAGTVPTQQVVETAPNTVVERRPVTQTVVTDDPVGNAVAASSMINTIVWAIVVLVLLVVALWALHVYAGLF